MKSQPFLRTFLSGFVGGAASLAASAHMKGSSICRRRRVSLGARLRELLASYFISSVLRSRILMSRPNTAVTSAVIVPFFTISTMNFSTMLRSG